MQKLRILPNWYCLLVKSSILGRLARSYAPAWERGVPDLVNLIFYGTRDHVLYCLSLVFAAVSLA